MKINVVFAIPPTSVKHSAWHDGFTAAMDLISTTHEVQWLNVHPHSPGASTAARRMFDSDALLIKSNFGWIPDESYMMMDICSTSRPPAALMVSGSIPPHPVDLKRFDLLFYETHWFHPHIRRHPRAVHAFGIDTEVMHVPDPVRAHERDIDWLMVGRPAEFKHPEFLLRKSGRRVLVGETAGAEGAVKQLEDAGVEVHDFVPYENLADIYRRTKTLVMAAELQGGGERAVLEARAAGASVELLSDNPKLQEVAVGPIYDHHYYAGQMQTGIEAVVEELGSRVSSSRLHSLRRLGETKARKAPHALAWHGLRVIRSAIRRTGPAPRA